MRAATGGVRVILGRITSSESILYCSLFTVDLIFVLGLEIVDGLHVLGRDG